MKKVKKLNLWTKKFRNWQNLDHRKSKSKKKKNLSKTDPKLLSATWTCYCILLKIYKQILKDEKTYRFFFSKVPRCWPGLSKKYMVQRHFSRFKAIFKRQETNKYLSWRLIKVTNENRITWKSIALAFVL